jgi:hypothetical protein
MWRMARPVILIELPFIVLFSVCPIIRNTTLTTAHEHLHFAMGKGRAPRVYCNSNVTALYLIAYSGTQYRINSQMLCVNETNAQLTRSMRAMSRRQYNVRVSESGNTKQLNLTSQLSTLPILIKIHLIVYCPTSKRKQYSSRQVEHALEQTRGITIRTRPN